MSADDGALFERLRRLRRELAAPRGAQLPAPATGIPDWLRARLSTGKAGERPPAPASEGGSLAPLARLAQEENAAGVHGARVERRACGEPHGAYRLDGWADLAQDAFDRYARDGSLAHVDLGRAVFLDIETTGLAGGAGTYPFLVALGRFDGQGFEVWQGFLRGPEEERALLASAAARIGAADCIVSFFGKSFDRHRLEDKMRLHGIAPPFAGRPHLDLYHPCARLYREALPDARLSTVERALCGVERVHDLSGAHAPAAWFDFLAGRPHRLEEVFRHNLLDVLSLVTLAAHVGWAARERRGDGQVLEGHAGERALGLARLAADRGERPEALRWLDLALARGVRGERRARALRADLLRLAGERELACSAYAALAAEREDEFAVHALLELAKHAEHRGRDSAAAAEHCARARRVLERACTGPTFARLKRELDRREERVRAKLA